MTDLGFTIEEEQILAAARTQDRFRASLPSTGRPTPIIITQVLGQAVPAVLACPCRTKIATDHPIVAIRYGTGVLYFHVECLKTLVGTLGIEPDRLTQLAAARGARRLTRT